MTAPAPVAVGRDLFPTVGLVISRVADYEQEIVKDGWLDPSWVASNGPRFASVQQALVLLYREWHSTRPFIHNRVGFDCDLRAAAAAMVDLAAAAVKTAIDLAAAADRRDDVSASFNRDPDPEPLSVCAAC